MTKGELKNKIDDCLVKSIIVIAKDPTIFGKVEQIRCLIFHHLTDDYWDICNDNDEVQSE